MRKAYECLPQFSQALLRTLSDTAVFYAAYTFYEISRSCTLLYLFNQPDTREYGCMVTQRGVQYRNIKFFVELRANNIFFIVCNLAVLFLFEFIEREYCRRLDFSCQDHRADTGITSWSDNFERVSLIELGTIGCSEGKYTYTCIIRTCNNVVTVSLYAKVHRNFRVAWPLYTLE